MRAILQPSLRGLSGKMGDWVYKYSKKKETTTIGEMPVRTRELSEAQLAVTEAFTDAQHYATEAMDDPARCEFYTILAEERQITPRNAAAADFFNKPSFKPLDLSLYKGNVGDPIVIRMVNEIAFVSMEVSLDKIDGTTIEKGRAVETGFRSGKWIYMTTTPVATGSDIFIKVVATDYAGKKVALNENPTVGEQS
jgi:hypothetical protein